MQHVKEFGLYADDVTTICVYFPPAEYLFPDQKRKMRLVERIRKNIAKLELKPEDVEFANE